MLPPRRDPASSSLWTLLEPPSRSRAATQPHPAPTPTPWLTLHTTAKRSCSQTLSYIHSVVSKPPQAYPSCSPFSLSSSHTHNLACTLSCWKTVQTQAGPASWPWPPPSSTLFRSCFPHWLTNSGPWDEALGPAPSLTKPSPTPPLHSSVKGIYQM